ncbi:anti-sigma factor domain-containing protein [Hydrogenophaga sp.]|uniref:anti-sigma factor domain-containing protein n=1 Tax=Hydrogenophaga sp. TaxID=1904254 RepID=UPI0027318AD5|nr:anti-sigma factor [Hydrogenophaga sp.]MDP2015454.1 anti-sigma factor [Hydrogenophaga sp.]MDP3166843.1 anti-sigma factor [Hydrogenophaga sp.]MDP3811458.1 anti-sigma factor [Hydrogenophaga sp.]
MSPTEPVARPRTSKLWLGISVVLALVLLVGAATMASMYEQLKTQIVHLQERLAVTPQVRYVSVLLDAQELPALLVTMDPQAGVLQVQRLNEVKEGREDSMQLWALSAGQPPRSLGVITSKFKTLQLPAKEAALTDVARLAISVENKGGVPEPVGPRLPYLFQGWLIQKAL